MTAVLIAIAMTTGACAFMFFVLPIMDAQKAKNHVTDSRDESDTTEGG